MSCSVVPTVLRSVFVDEAHESPSNASAGTRGLRRVPERRAAPTRSRRFSRDLVILLAIRRGYSHRAVAKAFGLSASRIAEIAQSLAAKLPNQTATRPSGAEPRTVRSSETETRRTWRNRILVEAWRSGTPRRVLGEAFVLSRSQVAEIVARAREQAVG